MVQPALVYSPDENKDLFKTIGEALVFAHSIQHGYRVDVISVDPFENFYHGSLCWKREDYYASPAATEPIDSKDLTEGWIAESIQLTNTKSLYIDEEILKWNDWNLVTQIGGNKPTSQERSFYISTSVPQKPSNVPLRYGRKYSFALRPVNVSGNSAPDIDFQINHAVFSQNDLCVFLSGQQPDCKRIKEIFTPPIKYLRIDGIHAPKIAYVKNVKTASQAQNLDNSDQKGKDLTTLVVKSIFVNNKLKIVDGHDIRLLSPPRVSLNFIIQHGLLDDEFKICQSNIDRLKKLTNYLIGLDEIEQRKLQETEQPEPETLYRNEKLNYLTDPLADGFEIVLDNHSYSSLLGLAPTKDNIYNWDKREHYAIVLEPVGKLVKDEPEIALDLEAKIKLKQGQMKDILIGCAFKPGFQKQVTNELFVPGIQKVQYTKLTFIHAVQRPCLLYYGYDANGYYGSDENNDTNNFFEFIPERKNNPGRGNNKNLLRAAGQTNVQLKIGFDLFPILTADTYTLFIQYIDVLPDRSAKEGYRFSKINKIIKTGFSSTNTSEEKNVEFDITNGLPDTRYYRVNYYIEAQSKYKHYFEEVPNSGAASLPPVNVYGLATKRPPFKFPFNSSTPLNFDSQADLKITLKEFHSSNDNFNIPSSGKPPAIGSTDIVPLLSWNTTKLSDGLVVERSCDTFRIYFDCDWKLTGWDEELAVFYLPENNEDESKFFHSGNTLKIESPYQEKSLSKVISQFGSDPISITAGVQQTIANSFFRETLPVKKIITPPLRDLEFEQNELNPNAAVGLESIKLSYVVYKVDFIDRDSLNGINQSSPGRKDYVDKGKFFVDVKVDQGALRPEYFSFLRFAIARYQDNAIEPFVRSSTGVEEESYAYHFSKIAVTNFVQPLPYRKFTIRFSGSTVVVEWHKENRLREVDNKASFSNELYLFHDGNGEVSKIDILEGTGEEKSLGGFKIDRTDNTYSFPIGKDDPALSFTLAEYECFPNEAVSEDLKVVSPTSPRNNIQRRLIFSYKFSKPK